MIKRIGFFFLFSTLSLTCGCAGPQYFWPQQDIGFQEINQPSLERRILIASRESEFKNAVVNKIKDYFQNQAVHIRIVGIEDLESEDAHRYSAVVVINTGMAWTIDRKAEAFLDRHKDLNSIIVLTTSDGGDILPDTKQYQIDAISSASVSAETGRVADIIINAINRLILGEPAVQRT